MRNRYSGLCAAAAILSAVGGAVLWAFFTEPETGFYSGPALFLWCFYGAGLLFLTWTARRVFARPAGEAVLKDTRRTGCCCLFAAAAAGWEAIRGAAGWAGALGEGWTLSLLCEAVLMVFGLLCAVVLLRLALHFLRGDLRRYQNSAALAIPVLWQCMRLVQRFSEHPTAVHIPGQLLELLLRAGETVFALSAARVCSRVRLKNAGPTAALAGIFCGICAAALFFPRALPLPGRGFGLSAGQAADLFYSLFALSFALDLLKGRECAAGQKSP